MIRLPDGTHVTMADVTAWLRASLHRGTGRPHRTAQGMTAERRADLDAQARAERLERTDVALGEHPAPFDLDVGELLDQAPAAANDLDLFEPWVARALSVLGLLVDGQQLDALCPWCGGRTPGAPLGGARTLRVRMLRDGRPAVVCEGLCEPPAADVGVEWRGMPAWPLEAEGAWLAGRIEHADEARRLADVAVGRMLAVEVEHAGRVCRCGQPLTGSGAGRPAAYCSDVCRREVRAERARAQRAVGGSAA